MIKLRLKDSLKAKEVMDLRNSGHALTSPEPWYFSLVVSSHTSLLRNWKTSQVFIASVPLRMLVATQPEIPQLPYHSLVCVHDLSIAYLAILQLLTYITGSLKGAGYSLGQQEFLYPIY